MSYFDGQLQSYNWHGFEVSFRQSSMNLPGHEYQEFQCDRFLLTSLVIQQMSPFFMIMGCVCTLTRSWKGLWESIWSIYQTRIKFLSNFSSDFLVKIYFHSLLYGKYSELHSLPWGLGLKSPKYEGIGIRTYRQRPNVQLILPLHFLIWWS